LLCQALTRYNFLTGRDQLRKGEAAMKEVVTTPTVDLALRTLDEDNRRRVHSWFGHLANWDADEFARSHSYSLDSIPGVHVLKTGTDFRIFFRVQENTITVLDIGKKQSILASGHIPEAG
jgi:mRNA-degrading endonuclease RelE of RelBE toxin-antitoxin system